MDDCRKSVAACCAGGFWQATSSAPGKLEPRTLLVLRWGQNGSSVCQGAGVTGLGRAP
jgi:hypothetical protein